MIPHITLKIENHVPHLFYTSVDGTVRQLTEKDEDISRILMKIGENFNLNEGEMDDEVKVRRMLLLSNEADSEYLDNTPEIDSESLEFELEELLAKLIEDSKNIEKEYSDVENMDPELRAELDRNQNIDIMASLLDTIYKIMIAKTLLAAYELEINQVHFKSEENYPRLMEKFGQELQKLGLDLIIEQA